MAVMYPDRIPEGYWVEPTRAAERKVYEALRKTLPDDFQVFGWVSWISKDQGGRAMDGEADFLVVHPEHGLLVIEVKGGGVAHDGASGQWTSVDRNAVRHKIKLSPYEQAANAKRRILKKLEAHPKWGERKVPNGHVVSFPDLNRPEGDLGPDAPLEITTFRGDLPHLGSRIESILAYWRGQDPKRPALGEDGAEIARQVFARSFVLTMPLAPRIEADAREMIRLTEPQYWVLDNLSRNRRMLVSGRAGTGKSLLALEKATRLASADGCRTLLTCFNTLLANFLRKSAGPRLNLTVMSFHELCFEWAKRAGLELPDPERQDLSTEFYRRRLPAAFVDALAAIPDRFDAIVVDEGQDFCADDRVAIELTLADRDESVLYVFQDEAQAIYRDSSPWPQGDMASYVLSENIRNTKAIHAVIGHLPRAVGTKAFGPTGPPPELIPAQGNREQARELSRVLHRLIREEGVPPDSIVILTSTRRNIPEFAPGGRVGAFELTQEHGPQPNRVLVDSVTRFKGLERDVVILVRLDPVEYCDFETLLYVGASRARAHLVIIAEPETLALFGHTATTQAEPMTNSPRTTPRR